MIEAKKNWMTPDKNIESGIIFFRNIFSVKKQPYLNLITVWMNTGRFFWMANSWNMVPNAVVPVIGIAIM